MGNGLRSGWQVLLCASVLASCGRSPKGEVVGENTAAVTQATFTLTAPKGMSVLAPALESATSLTFGSFSKVMPTAPVVAMSSTGTTWAEPDVQLNDLWSRGPTTLKDRDTILGWLHAPSLTRGNNVILDPAKTDLKPVFDPVSSLSWTVTFPSTTPVNVTLNPPNKASIDPGNFGTVQLNPVNLGGQGAELTLKTGTYYIGTLTLDSYSKVWLDQSSGPVIIYVSTINAFRGTFASLDGSPPDLFVGYIGANQLYVETQYNGALVAPNATMTIRTVTGGHTGFFAGKSIQLDANAVINYRAPNLVGGVAKVPQSSCKDLIQKRPDLTGAAQQAAYLSDLARYCGICNSTIDSDADGLADCVDGCPYDPNKTAPGIAGCGYSDTSTIPGGFPGGVTQCPNDPNNIKPGDCGCIGDPSLKVANTPCRDPDCPNQTNPVCDGQGQCGSRSCVPTGCRPITILGTTWFVCGGTPIPPNTTVPAKNQQGAYDACNAKGLMLARVDTYSQNLQIQNLLKGLGISSAWLGGNQLAASGVWRWAKVGSFNGDQFWSGGASGSAVSGRLTFWAQGNPGTTKCLAMQASDGRWVSTDCSQTLPYICENLPTVMSTGGGTGTGSSTGNPAVPQNPPPISSSNCVGEGSGPAPLPDVDAGMSVLMNQYALADAGTFTGAASAPPAASSRCTQSPLTQNCPLTNIKTLSCDNPATPEAECDCATENARRSSSQADICKEQFGTGYVCLAAKVDPNCVALDPSAPDCAMKAQCGIPDCSKSAAKYARCDQIDICPAAGTQYVFTDLDTGNTMTADTVSPAKFIAGTPVTAQSPTYQDSPAGTSGKDHAWCQLNPQNPSNVRPATTDTNKSGTSGGSSPVKVAFNPDLIFDADPKPLALGQTNLHLRAKAFLSARVDLSKPPLTPRNSTVGVEVFHAGIEAQVDRCQIRTGSDFAVFQTNIDLSKWIPNIDTDTESATSSVGALCKHSVADFTVKADRVKKAFRDAQQLLYQYKTLQAAGKTFGPTLCKDLGIDKIANRRFPMTGICPEDETTEITINRFIDFYQQDGRSEINELAHATDSVSKETNALIGALKQKLHISGGADLVIQFANFKSSQTKTLVKTPFAIGPVPMLLEIAVVSGYGLTGEFDLNVNFPTDIVNPLGDLSNASSPVTSQIAGVKTVVEPWASAGMTIYVGANFGIGSVGIEGGLTLAKVSAPVVAGVGVAVATTADTRSIPSDISAVSAQGSTGPAYVLGQPKAYQFYLTYDFGASVALSDVLSGQVNGRLTIDFWFFSRTWRKNIVSFTGWSKVFPLISQSGSFAPITVPGGDTINEASAAGALGRIESQLPLTYLQYLTVPVPPDETIDQVPDAGASTGAGGDGGAASVSSVDKSQIEQFSYDVLCCSALNEDCAIAGRPSCCSPLVCVGATEGSMGKCNPKPAPACAPDGAACGRDFKTGDVTSCCSGAACPINGRCPVPTCVPMDGICTSDADCCPFYDPSVGHNVNVPCVLVPSEGVSYCMIIG